jgi:archaellum component FlaC
MYLSDIFFDNGQLNWDAIGVISNMVLVAALVVITYWYAKKVSEQTELMVKDRERNKILEEVQDVLTPTIHHLEKEIKAIQDDKILWYERGGVGKFGPGYGGKETIKHLFNTSSSTFKDVIHKYPELGNKFNSHDDLRKKLSELYAEIGSEVRTDEFAERLHVLVNEFEQSREEVKLNSFDKVKSNIGYFIISKFTPEISTDSPAVLHDFWEEYKNELLKFRNTQQIKGLDKEIEDILSQLKELDTKILKRIEEIRDGCREEYNFTKYEIDPKLRAVEEW